jgi:hypothetical protein
MEKVISTSGHFEMVGNSLAFIGDVWAEDENGNSLPVKSGEHGRNDYNWNGYWQN